jgi:hypothetical protein
LVTGGGGVKDLVGFFDFFFFFAVFFFFVFSTVEEPSDTALPGERLVDFVADLDPVRPVFVFVVVVVFVGLLDVVDDVDVVDDLGAVEVEVEVEVEVVGGCWRVVVTVTDGVVEVAGGQVWETLMIGSWTGSCSVLGSVPGGTLWNVNCWPPWTVTTTVQPSADAAGIAPRPKTANRQNAVRTATATVGLRLLNTVACSSRGVPRANSSQLRSQVGLG